MSYCRWSSENFQCDIYCYEHCFGGIAIHVAANRIAIPLPEMPALTEDSIKDGTWLSAHNRNMDILDTMERLSIGLPYDGQSFSEATYESAVVRLQALRDLGYRFPERVIEGLMEDAQACE